MTAPPFTLLNSLSPITTQTYDGSGQAVHPDIIYFKDGFQGKLTKKYTHVLALTPYPNSNDAYENPSVIVSNSPTVSFYSDAVNNPIEPYPNANQHNSDPDILFVNGVFHLYFRYRNKSTNVEILYRKLSNNLVDWSSKESCNGLPSSFLSPAIIYDEHEKKFKMWLVTADYRVQLYVSSDGLNWTLNGITNIPQYINYAGNLRNCWHIDVQKTWLCKRYYALITYASGAGGASPTFLFWGESSDGLNWTVYDTPVLVPKSGNWDSSHVYRATFLIEKKTIKVWYSGASGTVWRIGYTESTIDFVDKDDVTLNVIGVRPVIIEEKIGLDWFITVGSAVMLLWGWLQRYARKVAEEWKALWRR